MNMRYVLHNHFPTRDNDELKALHQRYLTARSNRILFENSAHRGGEDPNQVLAIREKANKYRAEEQRLLKEYNAKLTTGDAKEAGPTVATLRLNGQIYNTYYVPRSVDPSEMPKRIEKRIEMARKDYAVLVKKHGVANVELKLY
jgi:hypothetical protein